MVDKDDPRKESFPGRDLGQKKSTVALANGTPTFGAECSLTTLTIGAVPGAFWGVGFGSGGERANPIILLWCSN